MSDEKIISPYAYTRCKNCCNLTRFFLGIVETDEMHEVEEWINKLLGSRRVLEFLVEEGIRKIKSNVSDKEKIKLLEEMLLETQKLLYAR